MSWGGRPDPTGGFNAGRWVRCMAVACIVWAGAILVAFPSDSPPWQWGLAFVIVYAAGWISPPVWLVAYIAERVVTSYKNGRQKVA